MAWDKIKETAAFFGIIALFIAAWLGALLLASALGGGCAFPSCWNAWHDIRNQGGTCYDMGCQMCDVARGQYEDVWLVFIQPWDAEGNRYHVFVEVNGIRYETTVPISGQPGTVFGWEVGRIYWKHPGYRPTKAEIRDAVKGGEYGELIKGN